MFGFSLVQGFLGGSYRFLRVLKCSLGFGRVLKGYQVFEVFIRTLKASYGLLRVFEGS